MMDRKTVNIAKAQVGFIDVIIQPNFELLAKLAPGIEGNVQFCIENKERWGTMVEKFEEFKVKRCLFSRSTRSLSITVQCFRSSQLAQLKEFWFNQAKV